MSHVVEPRTATAMGVSYTNAGDGTYIETDVSTGESTSGSPTASMNPTGMAPDGNWKSGAFFYGVAFSNGTNRIGHLAVNIDKNREMEHRRGDHDRDHDGIDDDKDDDADGDGIANSADTDGDNDGTPDAMEHDKNGDGIDDQYQAPGSREEQRTDRGTMAPGESRTYTMDYDQHNTLMLAVVEASELATPLAIDILDPTGLVIVSTPAVIGKAVATATPLLPGLYTVRVRNAGLTPATYKTTLIERQISY
jgi:hypothetical protein